MKTKIAIIGNGYLGKAFARMFQDAYDVYIYDKYPTRVEEGVKATLASREQCNTCQLAIICVPTPMKDDGTSDTSAVYEACEWVRTPLVLIKSAVIPGTADDITKRHAPVGIRPCVSPEYMGESKYFVPFWKYPHPTDGRMHDFFVIGGPDPEAGRIVDIFTTVLGPECRVIKMQAIEAEIVKYMENSWGATKVTFSNEFFEICQAFGADFQKVREGFLADGRVERMHTMVLPHARGFGGKCFPKDVSAIYHASTNAGYEPTLLKQVLASNEGFVKKSEQ